MCIICTEEYDENTTEIICCYRVTEIPVLPNLTYLWCYNTKVTEILALPNLTHLYCSDTNIKYLSLIYKNINIYSDKEIKFYNDYYLRKFQKIYRKQQFLRIIDKLPLCLDISKYIIAPLLLK